MAEWSAAPSSNRSCVLIVEDDPDMRALLRDVLEWEGFHVREHAGGGLHVPPVTGRVLDAIVLDNEMPGSRGLGLLREIRERHPDTPVVLVAGFGGAAIEAEALKLGAVYLLERPFRVSRLVETLRAVVGRAGGSSKPTAGRG